MLLTKRACRAAGAKWFSRATSVDLPISTGKDQKDLRSAPAADLGDRQQKPPLFDTHEVYSELTRSGFTGSQCETVIRVLDRTLRQSVTSLQGEYLPRQTYNQDVMRQWAELDQMRRNILVIEKTEIYSLKADLEKLKADLMSAKTSRERDLAKIENGSKLDNSLLKNQMFNDLHKARESITEDLEGMLEKAEHHQHSELAKEIAKVKLEAYRTIVALSITLLTLVITYLRFFPPWEAANGKAPPAPPAAVPPQHHSTVTDSASNTPTTTSSQYKLATTPVHLLKQAQLS
eukprot:TRINITY_DN5163_c0_g3_i1.p1 TRINITY_DN5163_c0_g3~~TRINITY_DN5163_c0_g3_i1.p1  ORF type:complete len:290 (+),score=110.73 TRINITY_DN5163_c0_g3_i1:74-943(+)